MRKLFKRKVKGYHKGKGLEKNAAYLSEYFFFNSFFSSIIKYLC